MVAAETENPRKILPPAYRAFVWRILVFFVGSAFCMGINVASNDPTLNAILVGDESGAGTGAASYVTLLGPILDLSPSYNTNLQVKYQCTLLMAP